MAFESGFQRWRYAAKPASWPKLLVPFALGQGIGVAQAGQVSISAFVTGLAFAIFDLLFIVYLNDWGDRDVDTLKRQMFPDGCSPKTIPDKILPARHLLLAGVACGGAALVIAALWALISGGMVFFVASTLSLGIFIAYSLPPIQLNYRGGGEFLEMIGVGAALPALQAYWQSGTLGLPLFAVLPGFLAMSFASAVASGLADEESDRAGGKNTFASTRGNAAARRLVSQAMALGCGLWGAGALVVALAGRFHLAGALVLSALCALAHLPQLRRLSAGAVTNAFAAQGRYKQVLHQAIWRSALLLALLVLGSLSIRKHRDIHQLLEAQSPAPRPRWPLILAPHFSHSS